MRYLHPHKFCNVQGTSAKREQQTRWDHKRGEAYTSPGDRGMGGRWSWMSGRSRTVARTSGERLRWGYGMDGRYFGGMQGVQQSTVPIPVSISHGNSHTALSCSPLVCVVICALPDMIWRKDIRIGISALALVCRGLRQSSHALLGRPHAPRYTQVRWAADIRNPSSRDHLWTAAVRSAYTTASSAVVPPIMSLRSSHLVGDHCIDFWGHSCRRCV